MENFGRWIIVASMLIAASSPAWAQRNTSVSRADSNLLLDLPGLGNSLEHYNYFGWDNSFAVETSAASASLPSAQYPRAQVYLLQLAKGYHWRGSDIDEAWVRRVSAFFTGRTIAIESGSGQRTEHLVTRRFRSENAPCLGFIMRHVTHDRYGSATGSGQASVEGIYCGAAGATLDANQERAILAGVYRRIGTEIVRALEGDASPIPTSLRR
jgi:hypothetical protein